MEDEKVESKIEDEKVEAMMEDGSRMEDENVEGVMEDDSRMEDEPVEGKMEDENWMEDEKAEGTMEDENWVEDEKVEGTMEYEKSEADNTDLEAGWDEGEGEKVVQSGEEVQVKVVDSRARVADLRVNFADSQVKVANLQVKVANLQEKVADLPVNVADTSVELKVNVADASAEPKADPQAELEAPAPAPSATRTHWRSSRSWRMRKWNLMKISEVSLRVGAGVFSLIAFSVMSANTETRNKVGNAVLITLKFNDFQAYNYLIAMNVIAVLYSIVQLIILRRGQTKGFFYSATLKWVLTIFLCDQLLGHLLFSASTSAVTASELSRTGLGDIWFSICSDWELNSFCIKAESAIGLSFLASFCVIASSLVSGYHLAKGMRDKF